ncbi:response regulator transcription factor [Flavobacterium sp. xlx-214]|uniref:LytR/AlgR family response regulator transcription factor n=1 Tax=unclassified Flavobacterium TaxID=196869 RepID=UPI0013D118A1|nr:MULTISPECIES: response regulator transcription factor [unclassified Flavobacterium]MBA5791687.1 response regulator transcription factor [Flavobacterium sp. xlx-221]QMI82930.1 response regulator transcription factor [Flavobacterium sp. xlx-214]
MKINCVIVDDERLAQEVLTHHISKFDVLELKGVCNNVIELVSFLNKNHEIDLVFLDINMPEINGTDFTKMVNNPPAIIYTTAYNQYAVEAFNQNAIDYLLKPISLERFSRSIQKASQILKKEAPKPIETQEQKDESFFIKSEKKLVKIIPSEVLYIEGMGNYVSLFTKTDKLILHTTMNSIEETFAQLDYICRVHKSFFVNINQINYVEQHVIILNNTKSIPIGLSYRQELYQKLKIVLGK